MLFSMCLILTSTTFADQVTGLASFTAGTPAKASEVNANFTAVKTAVDGNHARIAALEAAVANLQKALTTAQATITTLQTNTQALQNISPFVSLETINGQPTVRFSKVNVQIVNGLDKTDGMNGSGNLIVGYNSERAGVYAPSCSLGQNTAGEFIISQQECIDLSGIWSVSHKTGSHNIIVGDEHNYSNAGGIVIGFRNSIKGKYSSVSGGTENIAGGVGTSVSGGQSNTAIGVMTSVSGGSSNNARGNGSSVSGGRLNIATGNGNSVSGGEVNMASGVSGASVSGGSGNTASGLRASVSGGSGLTGGISSCWRAGSASVSTLYNSGC